MKGNGREEVESRMIALGAELSISPVGTADRHMKTLHKHSLLIAIFGMNKHLLENFLCGYCVAIG